MIESEKKQEKPMVLCHSSCKLFDPKIHEFWPKFEWAGFYMAGIEDRKCELCGEEIYVWYEEYE